MIAEPDFVQAKIAGPRPRNPETPANLTKLVILVGPSIPDLPGVAWLGKLRGVHDVVSATPTAATDLPRLQVRAKFFFEDDIKFYLQGVTYGPFRPATAGGANLPEPEKVALDFTFMRNAYFPSEAMLAALRHSLADLVDSYGSTQSVLNQKLAWFLECDATRVRALNGASQAFPLLRRLWARQAVAVPAPTFGEYSRAFPDAVTYPDAPGIAPSDLERLAGEVGVVVVVNPNNPTGTTLASADLHAVAARHAETTFLIDESFIDFSDQGSVLRELEAVPLANVVVLCSLSKTLGVPGLRIGYVYTADAALLDALDAEIPIWNMNAVAEYFVELLLKFRPQLAAALEQTKHDRELFRQALMRAPQVAHVNPGGGNFLLVRLHGSASVAAGLRDALLAEEAISIKNVTDRFSDGLPRVRLAVRRPHENERVLEALTRLCAGREEGAIA